MRNGERMLRSTVNRTFRADSTLSADPLAVLHWLYFERQLGAEKVNQPLQVGNRNNRSGASAWTTNGMLG